MRDEELKTINLQMFVLFFSLLSVIISIILTYNEKLNIENKKPFFSKKRNYDITLYNRILILLIAIAFLYINFLSYNSAKKKENNNRNNINNYQLQILVAILSVIASAISVYVVSRSKEETILDVEST